MVLRIALLFSIMILASGCGFFSQRTSQEFFEENALSLPIYDGQSGEKVPLTDFLRTARDAEVIVLGETHDDAIAHAFQRDYYETLFRFGMTPALALEMLERHHQDALDEFQKAGSGNENLDRFLEDTGVANWAGEGTWITWYQPIVNVAFQRMAPVFAANATREYVRAGWQQGVEYLLLLPEEEKRFFRLPEKAPDAEYKARFMEVMQHHEGATEAMMNGMYLSQSIWDATMAESVILALEQNEQVVILIGQFHSDFNGGFLLQLEAMRPGTRVKNISLQPVSSDHLRDEDQGRADFIIYTGQ